MRILLVHNFYGSTAPSGENKVFEAEKSMLEEHGETVETYVRYSDEIRVHELESRVRGKKWEQVVGVGSGSGTKDVSFRCPTPTCISHLSILPAIKGRCYRGSLRATLPLAINIWLYRKRWARWVDRFIVLSDFQKQIMVECGLPAEKIAVKGNFARRIERTESVEKKDQVLFVGGLSDEKGVGTLLKAWGMMENSSSTLLIAGDGVNRASYELLAESKVLVQPSACWETFGLTVVESMMMGTPVVISDLGSLPSLIKEGETGFAFKPGDAPDLARCLKEILQGDTALRMGARARELCAGHYTEEENFHQLLKIYKDVLTV